MHPRLEKYLTGSRFAGLEIQLTAEGRRLHFVLLRRKGKEVLIEKWLTEIESYEKLAAHLPKDIPVFVRITGKGVLYRRLALSSTTGKNKILSKIFPNASPEDFLMEIISAADDGIFVSVLRKSILDDIVKEIHEPGFSLVGVGTGSPAVATILPLFGEPVTELLFGSHAIHFKNNLPAEVSYNEELKSNGTIEIGGQKIGTMALTAFAAAFEQVAPFQKTAGENSYKNNFLQQKLFRKGSAALLGFTLFVLVINFFAFSSWRAQNAGLKDKTVTIGDAFRDLEELEKQVAEKKEFLGAAGLTGLSHHAYYADRLAAGLPNEIILTEMNLSPRVQLTEEDSIAFIPHEILLTGTCSESIILNSWIQKLKEEKWIRKAELEKYQQDKSMPRGEFHLLLSLE